jgi:nucleotide sugar dehydrogenase
MPGVDVEEVLGILHRDRRLSPSVAGEAIRPEILSYLRSGVGFGGSCLPKDIRALASFAASVGEESSLLDAVLEINAGQPPRVVTMAREALGTLSDRKVAVLGLAFKADTVDLRESPGLKIVDLLLDEGAKVTAYDALVPPAALARYERRGMAITPDLRTAIIGADLCIITTRAQEFRDIGRLLHEASQDHTVVIDGRRIVDPSAFGDRPFRAVGRGQDAAPTAPVAGSPR